MALVKEYRNPNNPTARNTGLDEKELAIKAGITSQAIVDSPDYCPELPAGVGIGYQIGKTPPAVLVRMDIIAALQEMKDRQWATYDIVKRLRVGIKPTPEGIDYASSLMRSRGRKAVDAARAVYVATVEGITRGFRH